MEQETTFGDSPLVTVVLKSMEAQRKRLQEEEKKRLQEAQRKRWEELRELLEEERRLEELGRDRYITEASRVETFTSEDHVRPVDQDRFPPHQLAKQGLYYRGFGMCRCFHCGAVIDLDNHKDCAEVLREHVHQSPHCRFLLKAEDKMCFKDNANSIHTENDRKATGLHAWDPDPQNPDFGKARPGFYTTDNREKHEAMQHGKDPGIAVTVGTRISTQPDDHYRMFHIDLHAGDRRLKNTRYRKSTGINTTPVYVGEIHPILTEGKEPRVFVRCNVEGNKGGWTECTNSDGRAALPRVQRLHVDLAKSSDCPVSTHWAVETDQGSSSPEDDPTITIEIRQVLTLTAKPAWGQPQTDNDIILFKKTLKAVSAQGLTSSPSGQAIEESLYMEMQRKREEHRALEQQLEQLNIQLQQEREQLRKLQATVQKND